MPSKMKEWNEWFFLFHWEDLKLKALYKQREQGMDAMIEMKK